MSGSRRVLAATLWVAILVGCSDGFGPDGMKLLSEGRGPKQELRFKVGSGDQQELAMGLTLKLSMTADGTTMPTQSVPRMSLSMDSTVLRVAPNGDITYEMRLDGGDSDVPPMSGSATITARGIAKNVSFGATMGGNPQLQQAMQTMRGSIEQFSAPFPSEPVGVGARWQHKLEQEVMGIEMKQITTFTLVSLKGTRGKVMITVEQEADADDFELPGFPGGASVELDEFKGRGSGYIVFDLEKIGPVEAELQLKISIEMTAEFRGEEKQAQMDMTVGIDIKEHGRAGGLLAAVIGD